MPKKSILHFIFSLGRGGAETMLVRVVRELPEYNNIIVTMYGENPFGSWLKCDKYLNMNLKSLFSMPLAIIKLRRIIKENNIEIVHSHLYWPTVVARIATPKKIPLITTIHTSVATALDYTRWRLRVIDKITFRMRKSIIIGVSKGAVKDYLSFIKLFPLKTYRLYTFVDNEHFNWQPAKKTTAKKFLIVSVGALRQGKNFEFLIKAFAKLSHLDIELHIYGKGPSEDQLKGMIKENNAPVILKGEVANIEQLLPIYDLYVSASSFEGFSLSILEAMAMKLPLLLSDIASFKEQCEETAVFYQLNDETDFIKKIKQLLDNPAKRNTIAGEGQKRVLENFTLEHHVSGLKKIYSETLLL